MQFAPIFASIFLNFLDLMIHFVPLFQHTEGGSSAGGGSEYTTPPEATYSSGDASGGDYDPMGGYMAA